MTPLQSEITALVAGWQPIETAPRDGSYIIAARFGSIKDLQYVKHSRWITAEEIAEREGDDDPAEYEACWSDGDDEDEPIYPTHWMSLVPPGPLAKEPTP